MAKYKLNIQKCIIFFYIYNNRTEKNEDLFLKVQQKYEVLSRENCN